MTHSPAMHTTFTTSADVMSHLDKLGLFHMDFRLTRMQSAFARLALDPLPFPIVQVLGTNGKGSTSAFLSSIAAAHGLRAGLYTSPHFLSPSERIRINSLPLPDTQWAYLANRVYTATSELTYFELLTLIALCHFVEENVDIAIFEAGLGGKHDATTALPADLLCFSPIALDHEALLGNTIAHIAQEKAGAIRSSAPVCTAPQKDEALEELHKACAQWKAPLTIAPQHLSLPLSLTMQGNYQHKNAALAQHTWEILSQHLSLPSSPKHIHAGLEQAFIAGRWQYIPAHHPLHPALILDGAHNTHGMTALGENLKTQHLSGVIFSCLQDKDWQQMLALLTQATGTHIPYVIVPIHNERALSPEAIINKLQALGIRNTTQSQTMPEALAMLTTPTQENISPPLSAMQDAPVLICGSLYLLELFYSFYPSFLTFQKATKKA